MWIAGWVGYSDPKVGAYAYPEWAIGMGWALASLSILPIPVFAVAAVARAPGRGCRVLTRPFSEPDVEL